MTICIATAVSVSLET